ncbi:hypothetical protein GEOBRER4_n1091 [Citrifermentans bremense]|uniref:Uncharacterized protein n=1 Tax=Citrifermentans bremense TaxID=60035 RepID=A0A7R7IZ43_9BACT|nr:hypothetical protein GEOBRER4_n1091 [Citrifermentans bremense]
MRENLKFSHLLSIYSITEAKVHPQQAFRLIGPITDSSSEIAMTVETLKETIL